MTEQHRKNRHTKSIAMFMPVGLTVGLTIGVTLGIELYQVSSAKLGF